MTCSYLHQMNALSLLPVDYILAEGFRRLMVKSESRNALRRSLIISSTWATKDSAFLIQRDMRFCVSVYLDVLLYYFLTLFVLTHYLLHSINKIFKEKIQKNIFLEFPNFLKIRVAFLYVLSGITPLIIYKWEINNYKTGVINVTCYNSALVSSW